MTTDGKNEESIDLGPKATPEHQKKLYNHSALQATTNRHNNKPLEWRESLEMTTTMVNLIILLF